MALCNQRSRLGFTAVEVQEQSGFIGKRRQNEWKNFTQTAFFCLYDIAHLICVKMVLVNMPRSIAFERRLKYELN